ncbi:hypothetical protein [Dysgonomonas sp. Marseille-P4361]|uniref:hypothetical protein n=1 Tax=Dysgonomonas sp. Marseille-P4361 TaxID=2161820 RepID=UPI000D559DDB|nr:hypothetical protein [Dysgonomonas sp. Marseille-P4361]
MKTMKFYFPFLVLLFISSFFISCSDDDTDPIDPITPVATTHFDIWMTTDSYGGGGHVARVVQSVESIENEDEISFKGEGVDVTAKLFMENIIKGQYYYQVPQEKDRFGKYKITAKGIEVIAEIPFEKNTLKDRRFAHAWINDKVLALMAANGDASKVIWIKVDTERMVILSEGELNLPALAEGGKFSTSGIAAYRKEDNKIIYTYCNNNDKTHFYAAFVNADDMSVETVITEDRAEQMGATAYGEMAMSKSFFDSNGNYYLVCASRLKGSDNEYSTQQYGSILRINRGSKDFDKSYLGFQGKDYSRGKIITIDNLSSDKVLLYIQDPTHTGAPGWGANYNCYYAVLDLKTDNLTELDLPYSEGTISQRTIVLKDKVYIGVNPEKEKQAIYIYDIKTGNLKKGLTIQDGFYFQRLVMIEN